jgi:hypothetical protein
MMHEGMADGSGFKQGTISNRELPTWSVNPAAVRWRILALAHFRSRRLVLKLLISPHQCDKTRHSSPRET